MTSTVRAHSPPLPFTDRADHPVHGLVSTRRILPLNRLGTCSTFAGVVSKLAAVYLGSACQLIKWHSQGGRVPVLQKGACRGRQQIWTAC